MLSHNQFEYFETLKKDKAALNQLKNTLTKCNSFLGLPESIRLALATKEGLERFLRDHHELAEHIKIDILTAKAIELNSVEAAILLVNEKYYRKKLEANFEQVRQARAEEAVVIAEIQKLMVHFRHNLQWLQALNNQFSRKTIQKYLAGNDDRVAILATIEQLNSRQPLKNNALSFIPVLFKNENVHKEANLSYFLSNPKKCAKWLKQAHVTDMFTLATDQQIAPLCLALAKHRTELLKTHITTLERSGPQLQSKIQRALTTNSSEVATDFLCQQPSKLTRELFKDAGPAIDTNGFGKYLLGSHNPQKLLKAHGDLINQNSAEKIARIKTATIDQVKEYLQANDVLELSTNFHLLVKYKFKLLKQALSDNVVRTTVMTALTSQPRNEWVIMHLKENPELIKVLCGNPLNSNNFLRLLPLTDNPGEFVRKLAGKIDSEDRAKIIFQSVIAVAKYTAEHPEYQKEFDKLLEERFWCNGWYRTTREIAVSFLSKEIYQHKPKISAEEKTTRSPANAQWLGKNHSEADLRFILQNENTKKLFRLTKPEIQQLAQIHLTEQSSHKVLAEHHYKALQLETEQAARAANIRHKSVYYVLQAISPINKRQKALNQAIFGVLEKDRTPETKLLLSQVQPGLFDDVNTLLTSLQLEDVQAFMAYFKKQIDRTIDIKSLDEIAKRFNIKIKDHDFAAVIQARREVLTTATPEILIEPVKLEIESEKKPHPASELKNAMPHSIEAAGNLFYAYAKDPERKVFLEPGFLVTSGLSLPAAELNMHRKIFYGAIVASDWDYIAKNKQKFIEALQVNEDKKSHFSSFEAIITQDVANELRKHFSIQELYQLKAYKSVKLAMIDQFTADQPLGNEEKQILIELLADRETQAQADNKIASIILANTNDAKFINDIIKILDPALPHPAIDNVFQSKKADDLVRLLIEVKTSINLPFTMEFIKWFEKLNLKNAVKAVKQYIFNAATMNQMIEAAQLDPTLENELLQSHIRRFSVQILEEDAAERFISWYQSSKAVQQSLTPLLNDILFLNQKNQNFITKLLDTMSDSKRFHLLNDARLDETFLRAYPMALRFRKPDAQKTFKNQLKTNEALLLKILQLNLKELPSEVSNLFKLDDYDLLFKVLKDEKLLGTMNKDASGFFSQIIPYFDDVKFLQALLKKENKSAAIAIIQSGHEELISRFWQAAAEQNLLVEQVLDVIIDDLAALEKGKKAITTYFETQSTRDMYKKYIEHSNLNTLLSDSLMGASLLGTSLLNSSHVSISDFTQETKKEETSKPNQDDHLDRSKMEKSDGKEVEEKTQPKTSTHVSLEKRLKAHQIRKVEVEFRYVEDIYKFLHDNRNELPELRKAKIKELRSNNPILLAQAFSGTDKLDFTLRLLVDEVKEYKPNNTKSTHQLMSPKIKSKKQQERSSQEYDYKESRNEHIHRKQATEEKIASLKGRVKTDEIKKILKTLDVKAHKNLKDRIKKDDFKSKLKKSKTRSVLAGYECIRSQYRILDALRQSSAIEIKDSGKDTTPKKSHLHKIATEYKLDSKDKLDDALARILEQANQYQNADQRVLAGYYYYEIITAANEIKGIKPDTVYAAIIELINLLIKYPSLFDTEDNELRGKLNKDDVLRTAFNSFFDTSIFNATFINPRIASLPLEWLESDTIVECMENNIQNEAIAGYIETTNTNKSPNFALANENLDKLKKVLEKEAFIIRRQELEGDETGQQQLLKEIFKRDPNLLLSNQLTFSFDVVLATASSSLDILLFYLRNAELSQFWLANKEHSTKLYALARHDELVRFVLSTCYKHLSKNIDKDALTKSISQESKPSVDENTVDDSVPPPPPIDSVPPIPPPFKGFDTFKSTQKKEKPTESDTKTKPKEVVPQQPLLLFNADQLTAARKNLNTDNKRQEKPEITKEESKPEGGMAGIAALIKQNKIKADRQSWQALFFEKDKIISPCGLLIMKNIKQGVSNESDINFETMTGFAEVYSHLLKCKVEITTDLVVKSLQDNSNLRSEKVFKDDQELEELANAILEVVKVKRASVPAQQELPPKPVTDLKVKEIAPISAKEQIENILVDKTPEGLYSLSSFLGSVSKLGEITEPLIALYEKFIRIKEKSDTTSPQELKAELKNLLASNMTAQAQEICLKGQKKQNETGSLDAAIGFKAEKIYEKFETLYIAYTVSRNKDKRPSIVTAISQNNSLFNNQLQQQTEARLKLYQLAVPEQSTKVDKPVFTSDHIKQVLGADQDNEDYDQLLKRFETALWVAIDKLQKGRTINKEILKGALSNIADRNPDNFDKDFEELIWKPLKSYAQHINKATNLVEKFELGAVVSAPSISELYSKGVFNKDTLAKIIVAEKLASAEDILVDVINYLQMNKSIISEEVFNKLKTFMVPDDAEAKFKKTVWEAIIKYAETNNKSHLVYEGLAEFKAKQRGPKLFDNSKNTDSVAKLINVTTSKQSIV